MDTSTSPLLIATANLHGAHSAQRYSREVEQGRLLRLRRGVYVPTAVWVSCTPMQRYHLSIAATSVGNQKPVFCRETALSLHGVPMLALPQQVHMRASSRGAVRTKRQSPLTGQLTAEDFWKRAESQGVATDGPPNPSMLLRGFDTARRPALRLEDPPTEKVAFVIEPPGPGASAASQTVARAEALGVALADTLPTMDFPHAVVALEGALNNTQARAVITTQEVQGAAELLALSARASARLANIMGFSSSLSESPGESLARVRFHELGISQPRQQVMVQVDGRAYRVDFLWPEKSVVGEFDGWMKYQQGFGESFKAEKLREDAIRSTGLQVVRFYWEDLMEPDGGRLLRLLGRAGIHPHQPA